MSQNLPDASSRTPERMMAELIHHMAEMVKAQKETNLLLQQMLDAQKSIDVQKAGRRPKTGA